MLCTSCVVQIFLDNFQISQEAAEKARQVAVDSTVAAVSPNCYDS